MEILRSPKTINAKLSGLRHWYNAQKYLQNLAIGGAWPCFDHRLLKLLERKNRTRTWYKKTEFSCCSSVNRPDFRIHTGFPKYIPDIRAIHTFITWVSELAMDNFHKVHIFWEGHKILRNFHLTSVLCTYVVPVKSKVKISQKPILWPPQNIWPLSKWSITSFSEYTHYVL